MTKPQVDRCLEALTRSEARKALVDLDVVNAANAPLQAGEAGLKVFQTTQRVYRHIVNPSLIAEDAAADKARTASVLNMRVQESALNSGAKTQ